MNDAVAAFHAKQSGFLPDHLGLNWIELRPGFARGRLDIGKQASWHRTGIFMPRRLSRLPIPPAAMAASCRFRKVLRVSRPPS